MTIEEYREEFLAQLRNNAQVEGNLNQHQFIKEAVELLEKNEELMNPNIFYCNMKLDARRTSFGDFIFLAAKECCTYCKGG